MDELGERYHDDSGDAASDYSRMLDEIWVCQSLVPVYMDMMTRIGKLFPLMMRQPARIHELAIKRWCQELGPSIGHVEQLLEDNQDRFGYARLIRQAWAKEAHDPVDLQAKQQASQGYEQRHLQDIMEYKAAAHNFRNVVDGALLDNNEFSADLLHSPEAPFLTPGTLLISPLLPMRFRTSLFAEFINLWRGFQDPYNTVNEKWCWEKKLQDLSKEVDKDDGLRDPKRFLAHIRYDE